MMETNSMRTTYRKGPIGALMDEYERAAWELKHLIERISEEDAVRIVDAQTSDEACRSVQTIMSHVVNAGFGYADYIRAVFAIPSTRPEKKLLSWQESLERIEPMLAYTVETLEGKWEMTDDEIAAAVINSGWGVRYDIEQLLEHAVMHVWRHRRQIDKFIQQGAIAA
jgi:uncharacterized damage-inducible protein DinB